MKSSATQYNWISLNMLDGSDFTKPNEMKVKISMGISNFYSKKFKSNVD